MCCQSFLFFFFSFFFSPHTPSAQLYIVDVLLLIVLCGTPPQRGLMNGAMSAPRIRTGQTLGRQSRARELNHSATGPAPKNLRFLGTLWSR